MKRTSGSGSRKSKDVVTKTSQIRRQLFPGPSKKNDTTKGTDSTNPNADTVLDNQLLLSLKKNTKEAITTEGKINIVSQIEGPREILCCKYTEDYEYIAGGFSDGVVRVYNANSEELSFTLTDADVNNNRAPVTSIQHRPLSKTYPITNALTATYANGCVKCWSYNFNQCLYTIREKRQTSGITYHPRFPKFVTYGDDAKVYFYDEESQTQERILMSSEDKDKHDGHVSRVFAACFHPRNNYELITGGWDDVVQFWDLRQPYATRHLSEIHMCGEGLDINQKGTEILAASFQLENPLQLFDYGSGKLIQALVPDIFNSKLYCGQYVSKDFCVTGGTEPNIFRLVDLQSTTTAASINFLPSAVYCMDIGLPKKLKTEKEKEKEPIRMKDDVGTVPKICFVSMKKLFQIDFY